MPNSLRKQAICPYGNPAKYVCVNNQCRKPGLICQKAENTHSQCWLFHETCTKIKWVEIEAFSKQNVLTKTPEFLHLQDKIQNLLLKTLQKVQFEHQKFKIWSKTYGHTLQAMKFIKILMDRNFDLITGDYMSNVMPNLLNKQSKRIQTPAIIQSDFQAVKSDIDRVLEKISNLYLKVRKSQRPTNYQQFNNHQSLNQSNPSINNSITNSFSIQNSSSSKDYSTKELSNFSSKQLQQQQLINPFSTEIQIKSKIVDNISLIAAFFEVKKLKSAKLLYRASEHNFSIKKFHELCDNIPDTLTVIHNQYGKKIGGYTPVQWKSDKKHWVADKSLQSFIFSIDMNEKFKLNLAQFAIASNPERGPTFGCCDICIVDNCQKQKSNCEFPISYNNNGKYARNQNTSSLFTGHPKGQFLVREWEIFKLQFQ